MTFASIRLSVVAAIALTATIPALSVHGLDPTAAVGVFAEQHGGAQDDAAASTLSSIGASGLFGWRTALGAGAYFGINGNAVLSAYLLDPAVYGDAESLSLELGFGLGRGTTRVTLGAASSLLGSGTAPAFLRPNWELRYQLDSVARAPRPYLAYEGSYVSQPNGTEDALFNGAAGGVEYRPSVTRGYAVHLSGGMRNWLEQTLFDDTGAATSQTRDDLVLNMSLQADGLQGFFLDWRVGLNGGFVSSNANRYLSAVSALDANSESKWLVGGNAEIRWSPSRSVALSIIPALKTENYLARDALDAGDTPTGEQLSVLFLDNTVRLEWAPAGQLFVTVEGLGGFAVANDPAEAGWSAAVRLSVDYSL